MGFKLTEEINNSGMVILMATKQKSEFTLLRRKFWVKMGGREYRKEE